MAKDSSMTSIFSSALSQWQDGRDYMYCDLVDAVKSVHQQSFRTAVKAVNRYATMRNWLIGFFIVEYQQKGKDRAAYGENLLKSLEQSLQIRGLNVTLFQNSRLFYSLYPQVGNLFMIKIQPTPSVKSVAEEIYYRENEMHDGDNPPVGILLCTKAGKKMVEYALAGMDNNLFVSTYLLQLPDKSVLEKFIKDNKG
jgi:hypothetical protein